jgi:hypothetical protein
MSHATVSPSNNMRFDIQEVLKSVTLIMPLPMN